MAFFYPKIKEDNMKIDKEKEVETKIHKKQDGKIHKKKEVKTDSKAMFTRTRNSARAMRKVAESKILDNIEGGETLRKLLKLQEWQLNL